MPHSAFRVHQFALPAATTVNVGTALAPPFVMRHSPPLFKLPLRRLARSACAICAATIMVTGCGDAEDTEEIDVTDNPIQPDQTDDAAPAPTPYDESLSYMGRYGQIENHSTDRFRFDVAAYRDDAEQQDAERLFASHAAFLSEREGKAIPSVQAVGTYVKQLDDTIYAGVEHAVQDGLSPTIEPKRTILTGALEFLTEHRSAAGDDAIAVVAASLRLGGENVSVPSEVEGDVAAVQEDFLAHPEESKPFGFYTWSDALQRIWQQDRLLQRELPSAEASCALAEAIAADASRKQRYVQLTQLYSRMTNPLESSLVDMLDIATGPSCASKGQRAFLSTSETPEVTLFNSLYPDGIPADADLMADLTKAIRAGTVDLTPGADDGWYQHQLYALETLLVTDRAEERAKVAFMARYKKRLQEAFSTMLVQHRETHAKQANVAGDLAMPMPETPHFRVEPLATVYVRHARSYVFLEGALDTVLGDEALDAAVSVEDAGPASETLRARIHRARDLFFGLYITSCQDIGLKPSLDAAGDPDPSQWTALGEAADAWLLGLGQDAVAGSDVRVIVPIARLDGGRMKYWAVLGVRATIAGYSYIEGTDVTPPKPEDQARVWLPTEQFLEVESSQTPLTRDEFRALCDQNSTPDAIKTALEAR